MSYGWSQEYEPEYEPVYTDENGKPLTDCSENSYAPIATLRTRPIARRGGLELLASTQPPPVSIEQQIEEAAADTIACADNWLQLALKHRSINLSAYARCLTKQARQIERANPTPPAEAVKQKDNGQMKLI